MKAAVIDINGPPSVLRYADVPDPVPAAHEVLIRVATISVEGGDLRHRRLMTPKQTPHVIGYQAAGTVAATGPGVTRIRVGQRVAGFHWSGSHAELFVVPEDLAFPLPDELPMELGATLPVTFGTADDALFEFGELRAGETVLVQGGAGGVGLAAIQLAKAAGAVVIATASSAERLDRLKPYGMDHGIDYRQADIAQEALRLTDGRGVDLVVDLAGGPGAAQLLQALGYRGRLVVVGAASGEPASFGFRDLLERSLRVQALYFGKEMSSPRVHQRLDRHLHDVAKGRLRMPIDARFPLSEAAAAHHHAETAHPFGRVLMIPTGQ